MSSSPTSSPTSSSSSSTPLSPPRPTACKMMYAYPGDEIFNNENTCIVLNQNCLSYRNFGRCFDIVEKYPYGDVAGLRKPDKYMKMYAVNEDRGMEGECIIKSPPHYTAGPTIATLITQYGIGRPIEDNNIAQKIVKSSRNKDLVHHLKQDTNERREHSFGRAMFKLGFFMSSSSRDHIKNIIIPVGIGRRGQVDDVWLSKYLTVIHKFSLDMEKYDKNVIILISETVRQILNDEFKNRNDDIVIHYKSLFNLTVINKNNFNCGKKTDCDNNNDDSDDSTWDYDNFYPQSQEYL